MDNLTDILINNGVAIALIVIFFIPYIKQKDKRIVQLSNKLQDEKDNRIQDFKDIIAPVMEMTKEVDKTAKIVASLYGDRK